MKNRHSSNPRQITRLISLTLLFFAQKSTVLAACVPGDPFGCVTPPSQLKGDLLVLFNNALRVVFIFAGIFAFLRFIVAGLTFMNAGGDVKKIQSAWTSIWQSLLGLIIMLGSFAATALIGQILFGDWKAILQPQVYGPN